MWRVHGSNTGSHKRVEARRELVAMAEKLLADPAYDAHNPAIKEALTQYRYDLAVILAEEGGGGASLTEAQALFKALPGRKAWFMAGVTALGPLVTRVVSTLKRILLMIRDPRQAALVSAVTRRQRV